MSATTSQTPYLASDQPLPKVTAGQGLALPLEGLLPLKKMTRLCALLVAATTDVKVALTLRYQPLLPKNQRWQLAGNVAATLPMTCSRCLAPCDVALDVALAVFLNTPTQAPKGGEVELATEELDSVDLNPRGELALLTLVEDELLLALPDNPQHATREECEPAMRQVAAKYQHEPMPKSPFAVLAQLKNKPSAE